MCFRCLAHATSHTDDTLHFRSGWSGNIRSYKGEPMHIKVDQNKTKVDLNSLAICKEIAKIDADKLAQREVSLSIPKSHSSSS